MTTLIQSDRTRVRTWMERLTLARAIRTIVFVATLMVLAGGVLVRVVEPHTFTSIGLAFWWAMTTVTTVGYGDIVPESTAGRIVGSALMLTGVSLIPLVTSVAVSILTAKRAQLMQQEQEVRLEQIEQLLAELRGASPPAAPPSGPSEAPPPRAAPS
jgi:voltage-gated potassium channel Kch